MKDKLAEKETLQQLAASRLATKYRDMQREYNNVKIVNDLIYNEQTHVVSVFKDYLIHDDINEFLKRRYTG